LAGNIDRRQGRWEEAERNQAKAVELDPRNVNAIGYLADTQILMRKFPEASRTYGRGRAAGLVDPVISVRAALVDLAQDGSVDKLRAALAEVPSTWECGGSETSLRVLLALIDRDYDRATKILAASPRADFQDIDFSFSYPRSWYEAIIARAAGDDEKAKQAFVAARAVLEEKFKTNPTARILGVLAEVYAGLGLNELALEKATLATDTVPISRDAYNGPLILQSFAQAAVWTGDKSRAIETIRSLLKHPGYLTYGFLLKDPAWAPLRDDPQFQALLQSQAPPSQ